MRTFTEIFKDFQNLIIIKQVPRWARAIHVTKNRHHFENPRKVIQIKNHLPSTTLSLFALSGLFVLRDLQNTKIYSIYS
jgi:hypothetical protein